MSKLVTIYGGSGFVGRYVAQRMARAGWQVRIAVRRPNEAIFMRGYGAVGQVEPVLCNIRNEDSVRRAMDGASAVVNCVGILNAVGKNSFDAVQAEGAATVARLAADSGVAHLVHLSAIGADKDSDSHYARSKAAGEAAVLAAFPGAVILRPSVIFGTEDAFFNRFAALARMLPVVPLVGGATRFQPVHVENVAEAAELAATGVAPAGVYQLGGPEVMDLRAVMARILTVIQRRRVVLPLPSVAGAPLAFGLDMVQSLTAGLIENRILTRDQLRNLRHDNVVAEGARGLSDLGIAATPVDSVIADYLWRFRPAGQYAAIKQSARKLRA